MRSQQGRMYCLCLDCEMLGGSTRTHGTRPCLGGAPPGLRTSQQMFLGVLLVTALVCVCIEVLNIQPTPLYPSHVPHHVFITGDNSDGRRLGNVLFCYAAMLGIAHQNNMTPVMPASSMLVQIFDIKTMLTPNIENTLSIYRIHEEYGRRGSAYDFGTRKLPQQNTKLLGYYQSWKYFDDIQSTVRENLNFKPQYFQPAVQFLQSHQPNLRSDFVRVGVHVRRGDMLQEYYKRYGYVVADAQYFHTAMEYFKSKFSYVQFVVCSDDIEWCKENIHGENVIFSEGHTDKEDLAILAQCNHTIVSVGSFGWWAAYLANGITVYYDKWPKEFSMLEYNVDKLAYFPPHWIPLH